MQSNKFFLDLNCISKLPKKHLNISSIKHLFNNMFTRITSCSDSHFNFYSTHCQIAKNRIVKNFEKNTKICQTELSVFTPAFIYGTIIDSCCQYFHLIHDFFLEVQLSRVRTSVKVEHGKIDVKLSQKKISRRLRNVLRKKNV